MSDFLNDGMGTTGWWKAAPPLESGDDPFSLLPDGSEIPLSLLTHDFYVYALGYKIAGDAVADRAVEDSLSRNLYPHPILFLYRHYIELALKDIAASGRQLFGQLSSIDLLRCHCISTLWEECKQYILIAWPKEDGAVLDAAQHVIVRFADVDPRSFNFRYPVTQKGQNIDIPVGYISLNNLKDVMNKLEGFLVGVASAFEDWKQNGDHQ